MAAPSASSRDEASATVSLLQALGQFREAFPKLPDEDFQLSVLAILPSHFEKVVEVWEESCEHFRTLDNLMRLVDGIAHALAVSSAGEQGGPEGAKAEKQVDSKEFLRKLNDYLASGAVRGAAKREPPPATPELVDLTRDDEEELKPKVKHEDGGRELSQIFAQDDTTKVQVQQATPRRAPLPGSVQLKRARLSLPPPPPPPPPTVSAASTQPSSSSTNMLQCASSSRSIKATKTPAKPTAGKPVNGLRDVLFEIVNEEFSIARRREYFHDYQPYAKGGMELKFRSGPVRALGHGYLYLAKYGDIVAYHVPDWRTDGISYKAMKKGLRRPIDERAFGRLFKELMEQPKPRRVALQLRLNEFCWDERKSTSTK